MANIYFNILSIILYQEVRLCIEGKQVIIIIVPWRIGGKHSYTHCIKKSLISSPVGLVVQFSGYTPMSIEPMASDFENALAIGKQLLFLILIRMSLSQMYKIINCLLLKLAF